MNRRFCFQSLQFVLYMVAKFSSCIQIFYFVHKPRRSKMAKIHEIFSSKLQFTTISNFSYLCGCIWEIWVLFQIEILKSVSILKKKDTLVTLDRNCAAFLMLTGSHKHHLKAWAGLFKAELR